MAKGKSPMAAKKPAAIAFAKAAAEYRALRGIGDDRIFHDLGLVADYGPAELVPSGAKERAFLQSRNPGDKAKVRLDTDAYGASAYIPMSAGGHATFAASRDKDERLLTAMRETGALLSGVYRFAAEQSGREDVDVDVEKFVDYYLVQLRRLAGASARGAVVFHPVKGTEYVYPYEGSPDEYLYCDAHGHGCEGRDGCPLEIVQVEVIYPMLAALGNRGRSRKDELHPVVAQQTGALIIATRIWGQLVSRARRDDHTVSLDALTDDEAVRFYKAAGPVRLPEGGDLTITQRDGTVRVVPWVNDPETTIFPYQPEPLRPHNPEMVELHYKKDMRAAEDNALADMYLCEIAALADQQIVAAKDKADPRMIRLLLSLRCYKSLNEVVRVTEATDQKKYQALKPRSIALELIAMGLIDPESYKKGYDLPRQVEHEVAKALTAIAKAEDAYFFSMGEDDLLETDWFVRDRWGHPVDVRGTDWISGWLHLLTTSRKLNQRHLITIGIIT